MHERAMDQNITESLSHLENDITRYTSVEISNQDIRFCYHFKLWNMAAKDMCILVKEDSQIMPQLKEGATFNMKYYGSESLPTAEKRKTTIRDIKKDESGRFKGHYLVHLVIMENELPTGPVA